MKQIELVIRTLENSTVVKEEVLSRFDCGNHLPEKEKPLHFSGLCIDLIQHQISFKKKELPLTEKEYQVFVYLTEQPKRVFTKEQIYQAVWKEEPVEVSSAVFCIISNIRQKLREVTTKEYIQTVWGVGYKFVDVPGE